MSTTDKKITAKKLPSLLKKAYSEKQLENKLLKKLYIAGDREFMSSYFVSDSKQPNKKSIRQNTELNKADFIRLKLLTKQIKKQGLRVKFIPLAAVLIFIVSLCAVVLLFKDSLVKSALIHVLQNAAGAKTEIGFVHVGILDSVLTVKNLRVADKNNPMKNIFEAQKIEADFNLTQLLKRRFVCENLEVSGMAFATERKTSGALSKRKQKKQSKRTAKAGSKKSGSVAALIEQKKDTALDATKQTITRVFEKFDPKMLIDDAQKDLRSPQAAQKAREQIESVLSTWENRPEQLEKSVSDFSQSVQKLIERDYKKITNIGELQIAFEELNRAAQDGKTVSQQVQSAVSDIKKDGQAVRRFAKETADALKYDTSVIAERINKVRSFKTDDGKNLISQSITSVICSILGKYYPYAQTAVDTLVTISRNSAHGKNKNRTKKTKRSSTPLHRLQGRTIDFGSRYPSFLIERVYASGTGFEAQLSDISNDPDMWGKPAALSAKLDEKAVNGTERLHTVNAIVNTGEKTDYPLIHLTYEGTGYELFWKNTEQLPGIPSLNGTAALHSDFEAFKAGGFAAKTALRITDMDVSSGAFEPEFVWRIYNRSLASIRKMELGINAAVSADLEFDVDVVSDADSVFQNALKNGINEELTQIKRTAIKTAQAELEKYTGSVNEKLSDFNVIEKNILKRQTELTGLQNELEERKNEIKKRIERGALNVLKSAAAETSGDIQDTAATLRGLFGR
ncbi:MAG: TIGR03545 family protein [Treponema lecithinolyticum]|uniref:TIGR03545 family protein n=1 Tax=Treponema lecithinolyticum TaxID=53418 RepID=UPI003607349F